MNRTSLVELLKQNSPIHKQMTPMNWLFLVNQKHSCDLCFYEFQFKTPVLFSESKEYSMISEFWSQKIWLMNQFLNDYFKKTGLIRYTQIKLDHNKNQELYESDFTGRAVCFWITKIN